MTLSQARALARWAKDELIHNSAEAADDGLASYYCRWPSAGYSTMARIVPLDDGRYVFFGWHADSCE